MDCGEYHDAEEANDVHLVEDLQVGMNMLTAKIKQTSRVLEMTQAWEPMICCRQLSLGCNRKHRSDDTHHKDQATACLKDRASAVVQRCDPQRHAKKPC